MASKETFFLQNVVENLRNTEKSLSSALIDLQYFAKRTKNQELLDFTTNEIEGYKIFKSLPDYRKISSVLSVQVQDEYGEKENFDMQAILFPPEFREALKQAFIADPVITIEQMVLDASKKTDPAMYRAIPIQMFPQIQDAIKKYYRSNRQMNLTNAMSKFSYYKFAEIPTVVRFRLLNLVMDMGEKFGSDIDISMFQEEQEKNNNAVIKIMHTTINNIGDGNVANTGDQAQINVQNTIQKNNVDQLRKALLNDGIDEKDVEEITQIVQEEKPDPVKKTLGKRAIDWIGKVAGKAINGVGKIATSVTSAVLGEYLKQFYGLK